MKLLKQFGNNCVLNIIFNQNQIESSLHYKKVYGSIKSPINGKRRKKLYIILLLEESIYKEKKDVFQGIILMVIFPLTYLPNYSHKLIFAYLYSHIIVAINSYTNLDPNMTCLIFPIGCMNFYCNMACANSKHHYISIMCRNLK